MESSRQNMSFERLSTSLPGPDVAATPVKHTESPVTTGTSVIAIQFDKGVLMAADMLGSYGSLSRYRNISRLLKVNDKTVLGCTGDYADYQYLKNIVEQIAINEAAQDDGFSLTAKSLHSWLTRVLYNRRTKFDPLWCTFVVGGLDNVKGEETGFLGFVDKIGTAYQDGIIATGYGMHIAAPILRATVENNGNKPLNEAQAREVITKCMEVLFYRDARASNRYEIAVVTAEGAKIEDPVEVKENWELAHLVKGYE